MAKIIVLGNEKGGSGKSTTAMHLIVALAKTKKKVAVIDLDLRQKTLYRYLENRDTYCKRHKIKLPTGEKIFLKESQKDSKLESLKKEEKAFSEKLFDYCITSGQIALNNIKKDIYKKFGRKCYPLELSKQKIKYFNLDCTKKVESANFAMIADLKDGLSILDFAEHLDKIMKYKLPLLCANPDYLVHNKNTLSMSGGTVAELYSDLGGTVFRYGKPYEPIYQDIFKKMRITNLSKVLVIGDSLWHDIAGGKKMKLDSLWIKNGIHKSKLKKKDEISPLLEKYRPKYAISHLKL